MKKSSNKQSVVSIPRWRFVMVLVLLGLLVAGLLANVALLQVVPGYEKGFEFLQSQGEARTIRLEPLAATRGVITDRNGEPLAVSTPVVSIWANPTELVELDQSLAQVAHVVGISEANLRAKLQRYASREYMYLRRQLPPQQAESILSHKLPGIYGEKGYKRFYPAGEVGAHVVGVTDIDGVGQEGLELSYDDWLQGESGIKRVVKDLKGRVIRDDGLVRAPKAGGDMRLSIDLRVQYLAYRELKQAVANHRAKAGSLVLMDVETGEVLAMVNYPSFNPNDRDGIDASVLKSGALRNRVVTDQFEPGSTMKPLAVMAALETGRYDSSTEIDTSPGYIRLDGKMLHDPVNYGVMDLAKILKKSSQVGISKIALDMEPDQVRDIYYRFGLGQGTGIGYPGERVGSLPNHARWTDIERANFAFGHGLSLTALQLAQAYSVIASDGVKKSASLLYQQGSDAGDQVVTSEIAIETRAMLSAVAESGGTAARARSKDYPFAGKTGTAHKLSREGGYSDDKYIGVFAGMAPADNPRVAAVVVIDEPSAGEYYGGEVAAPVFSKVVDGTLRLLNVPPQSSQVAGREKRVDKAAAMIPVSGGRT